MILLLGSGMILGGCSTGEHDIVATGPSTAIMALETQDVQSTPVTYSDAPASTPTSTAQMEIGYTYHRADGNRLVMGRGALPSIEPIDIPLAGQPEWLVAAPLSAGGLWAVALQDGRLQAFQTTGDGYEPVEIQPERIAPGAPPLLRVTGGSPTIIQAPGSAAANLTHPIPLGGKTSQIAFIDQNGDVVIWEEAEIGRLAVDALADARLLVDEAGRLLVLTNPSTRYDHGVLGDTVEAGGITLIETSPTARVLRTIEIPAPKVVEGIAPIWADITGDGVREIIVTLSDASEGAQVVIYNEAGEQIAKNSPIGRGYRWRNQLAVAPFGAEGSLLLVDVLTPHILGVVEFLELNQDRLVVSAQVSGFTSHVIGSRNLDMALSGDFDGDGQIEVLIPDQARKKLGGISLDGVGASADWILSVDGLAVTNLAGISFPDGSLAVAVGKEDGTLRVWAP